MATKQLPLKRKIEAAFAGYLIDQRKADPAFMPEMRIICAHTGRSPDDPASGEDNAVVDPLPYLTVTCGKTTDAPDWPPGYGIKHCLLMFSVKTDSDDEGRDLADERTAELASLFMDQDAITAIQGALNQPAVEGTPDARRVRCLYLYDVLELEEDDEQDAQNPMAWDDAFVCKVIAQGFDPDYS